MVFRGDDKTRNPRGVERNNVSLFEIAPVTPSVAANRTSGRGPTKIDESATTLLTIIAEVPTQSLAHSALAVVMQKLGRFDEAIAHAKKVVELEPNDPFSFAQLSVICQRCGRIADAEDALARNQSMSAKRH